MRLDVLEKAVARGCRGKGRAWVHRPPRTGAPTHAAFAASSRPRGTARGCEEVPLRISAALTRPSWPGTRIGRPASPARPGCSSRGRSGGAWLVGRR
eukprot:3808669-Prymnesium_polylepis.1